MTIAAFPDENNVLEACGRLVDFNAWEQTKIDPEGWLSNFSDSERPFALVLLSRFTFLADHLVDQLFRSAFQNLSNVLFGEEWPEFGMVCERWRNFCNSALITIVQGETPKSWDDRLGNYRFAVLFTLRRRRPGIRKYYAGWRTYTLMAGGNIRYLLELVGQALLLQRRDEGSSIGEPIRPELQTLAATQVGRKNLSELEGLSVHGAQLTKLLLGLGRVFEVLASEPEGHTPEVTQFSLPDDAPLGDAEQLLTAAVMHLALVRSVANKRMDLDLKGYDYSVHPIYSAFFVFSYRRKRKLKLTPNQLMALVREPKTGIRQILRQNNRGEGDYPLPDQLRLFEGFYDADR